MMGQTRRTLRVLIVEDTPDRQTILRNLYRDHAWILVHTAARANRLVDAYDFDLISLDYDLAGPKRGDVIAEHLTASRNANTPVVVHSMNHPGSVQIRQILPGAICVPLSRLVRNNRVFKKLRSDLDDPDIDLEQLLHAQAKGA